MNYVESIPAKAGMLDPILNYTNEKITTMKKYLFLIYIFISAFLIVQTVYCEDSVSSDEVKGTIVDITQFEVSASDNPSNTTDIAISDEDSQNQTSVPVEDARDELGSTTVSEKEANTPEVAADSDDSSSTGQPAVQDTVYGSDTPENTSSSESAEKNDNSEISGTTDDSLDNSASLGSAMTEDLASSSGGEDSVNTQSDALQTMQSANLAMQPLAGGASNKFAINSITPSSVNFGTAATPNTPKEIKGAATLDISTDRVWSLTASTPNYTSGSAVIPANRIKIKVSTSSTYIDLSTTPVTIMSSQTSGKNQTVIINYEILLTYNDPAGSNYTGNITFTLVG